MLVFTNSFGVAFSSAFGCSNGIWPFFHCSSPVNITAAMGENNDNDYVLGVDPKGHTELAH